MANIDGLNIFYYYFQGENELFLQNIIALGRHARYK